MKALSVETQTKEHEFREDLAMRARLLPIPPDLPTAGALVRLVDGRLAEILRWFDRNPNGYLETSNVRVALVELIDGPIGTSPEGLEKLMIAFEDGMTVFRAEPSETFIRRWLALVSGPLQ